ncbi:MAG: cell division protein SepF [Actinobacteria bacterium]|nr:cell division protein SepF [Actinomycetota bacterium]
MALGDQWRKVLAYFGMSDEDEEYFDDDEEEAPRRASRERERPVDDLERSYRERPNVRRLSSRRRADEFDEMFAEESQFGGRSRPSPVRAVESIRQPTTEVHLIVPKSFNEAQQIADKFKVTVPVILNLQSAETDLARRLIDFASGLTYALDGGMQRVADKVFLLTPRNVEVSAEEKARLLEKGFFNQY